MARATRWGLPTYHPCWRNSRRPWMPAGFGRWRIVPWTTSPHRPGGPGDTTDAGIGIEPEVTPWAGIRPSDSPHNRIRHGEPPGPPAGNNSYRDSHKLFRSRGLRTPWHKRRSRAPWLGSTRRCPATGNRRTGPDRLPADRGSACPRILLRGRSPPPDRQQR
jgi:hypothetical protein